MVVVQTLCFVYIMPKDSKRDACTGLAVPIRRVNFTWRATPMQRSYLGIMT